MSLVLKTGVRVKPGEARGGCVANVRGPTSSPETQWLPATAASRVHDFAGPPFRRAQLSGLRALHALLHPWSAACGLETGRSRTASAGQSSPPFLASRNREMESFYSRTHVVSQTHTPICVSFARLLLHVSDSSNRGHRRLQPPSSLAAPSAGTPAAPQFGAVRLQLLLLPQPKACHFGTLQALVS